ncbi:signal peptide peptidase SppA [Patescibacteria group bacterium]
MPPKNTKAIPTPAPVVVAPPPEKKSSSGWKWAVGCLIVIIILTIVGVIGTAIAIMIAAGSSSVFSTSSDYTEAVVSGDESINADKIAIIELSGIILAESETGSILRDQSGTADSVLKEIDLAIEDERIKAIVLLVDSPGGTVTTSEDLYQKVKEAQDADKEVVSFIRSSGTSGAYYMAVASDYIVAHPTSLNGSVGVIMQSYNYEEALSKIGVEVETYKTGKHKDILSGTRETTKAEEEIAQSIVDEPFELFVQRVEDNRDIKSDDLEVIKDGRVFTANQALARGLVDSIGQEGDAIEKAADLADTDDYYLIRYEPSFDLFTEFSSSPLGVVNWSFVRNLFNGETRRTQIMFM